MVPPDTVGEELAMKVTALETYCLSAPLPQPVRTSNSTIIQVSEVIVKLTTDAVHALLGGALRERVPAYVTGFYYRDGERPDDLQREATMYLEKGYRTLKVKVAGLAPEADAERVALIRRTVGRDVQLMLDANQG